MSICQAFKEKETREANILTLIKTMNETFSIINRLNASGLKDKIADIGPSIGEVIGKAMTQIMECCQFIREYTDHGFISTMCMIVLLFGHPNALI